MKLGEKKEVLFCAGELQVKPVSRMDLEKTLEVYKQVEDFLSLGPVPKATMKMVLADIKHSKEKNGIYCGIWNDLDDLIGVLDFIPDNGKVATLSLLMISKPYRKNGYGRSIVKNLEEYLKRNYRTERILSGVQINNEAGIIFWKKMGFQIDVTPQDMGDGTTAYEMTKELEE
jgi:ribosomal protein S18 acetylase RimI-like enzyme